MALAPVFDLGLDVLTTESAAMYLCEGEPTSYALATRGLRYKSFGAGGMFGPPFLAADGNGSRVTSSPVAIGTFVSTDTVRWWAVVGVDELCAYGSAQAAPCVAGNSFTTGPLEIVMRQH